MWCYEWKKKVKYQEKYIKSSAYRSKNNQKLSLSVCEHLRPKYIDSLKNSVPFRPALVHYNFKHRFILCVCYLCVSIQLSPQLCRGILLIWARELTGQSMRFDVFQWTFAAYKLSYFQWAPCNQRLSLSFSLSILSVRDWQCPTWFTYSIRVQIHFLRSFTTVHWI